MVQTADTPLGNQFVVPATGGSGGGGGGGGISYAWIGSDATEIITLTTSRQTFEFDDTPVGEGDAGWELNGDLITWDCISDGVYVITMEIGTTLFCPDNSPAQPDQMEIHVAWNGTTTDPDDPWNTLILAEYVALLAVPAPLATGHNYSARDMYSLPPMHFQAGDSFIIEAYALYNQVVNSRGSAGVNLVITRLSNT